MRRVAPILLLPLAGCAGPLSTLDPAGPAAQSIATLWWVMFWGSVVISLAMFALLTLVIARPGALSNLSSRSFILYGGLVFPSAVLAALLVYALAMGERLIPRDGETSPLRIEIVARQWVWEIAYPELGAGVTTRNEVHIPAGRDIDFAITSADVIHSFWIPRLGGKMDAIPGHENVIRLSADRAGTYRGVCAEFCGTEHARMTFTVVAHEPDAYEAAITAATGEAR